MEVEMKILREEWTPLEGEGFVTSGLILGTFFRP
jgi:hypothetical protein